MVELKKLKSEIGIPPAFNFHPSRYFLCSSLVTHSPCQLSKKIVKNNQVPHTPGYYLYTEFGRSKFDKKEIGQRPDFYLHSCQTLSVRSRKSRNRKKNPSKRIVEGLPRVFLGKDNLCSPTSDPRKKTAFRKRGSRTCKRVAFYAGPKTHTYVPVTESIHRVSSRAQARQKTFSLRFTPTPLPITHYPTLQPRPLALSHTTEQFTYRITTPPSP